jgi:hypothetical protein
MYVPPIGNAVHLEIGGSYAPPDAGDVQLQFGDVLDNFIRSSDVLLDSIYEQSLIGDVYLIRSFGFDSELIAEQHYIDPLVHIQQDSTEYELELPHILLEILPDIINAGVELEYLSDNMQVGGNSQTDLPKGISPGMYAVWGLCSGADIHFDAAWEPAIEVQVNAPVTSTEDLLWVDTYTFSGWSVYTNIDPFVSVPFEDFYPVDLFLSSPWESLIEVDRVSQVIYTGFQNTQIFVNYLYNSPRSFDKLHSVKYVSVPRVFITYENTWNTDIDSDAHHTVPWGPRELYAYCFKVYTPPRSGLSIDFHFPAKYPLTIGADVLNFGLDHYSSSPLCNNEHQHTGIRDNYVTPGIEVAPIIPPIPLAVKKVYYIMNTVLVQTLPDHTQIEIIGVQLTTDRDSWLWQLSMTIGKREYIDLLSPKNGTFPTVEVYINGWRWVFLIEKWTENRGFGKGTYNVTGRSPSMVLGDPLCDKKTLTVGELSTGSYIIDGILSANSAATGFSVSFAAYENTQTGFDPVTAHWNIPSGTFSYTNQTDIQAIQTLVDSIGAYVQTNPAFYNYGAGNDGRFLSVLPKYAWQPWNWSLGNTELDFKILDEGIIREMGSSYVKNPDYYGAYIVGEAGKDGGSGTGIFCDVYKQEKGQACLHAPVISSPLFTTDAIAQEKGRMIIAEAGIWQDHSIRVFSLFPFPQEPGLFAVGDLINVTKSGVSDWIGLIKGVSIEASLINKSAFSVSQNLNVSQYVGEWNG